MREAWFWPATAPRPKRKALLRARLRPLVSPDYHTAQGTRIRMKWSTGADAQNWEAVAKKDNLNVIQVGPLACTPAAAPPLGGDPPLGPQPPKVACQQCQQCGLEARSWPCGCCALARAQGIAPGMQRVATRRAGCAAPAPVPGPAGLQTEMRRLEHVVQTIHIELQNIRRKEERMRDVNGEARHAAAMHRARRQPVRTARQPQEAAPAAWLALGW